VVVEEEEKEAAAANKRSEDGRQLMVLVGVSGRDQAIPFYLQV
jgi:hypothetical protein